MRTGGGATSLRSLHEDVAPLVRRPAQATDAELMHETL